MDSSQDVPIYLGEQLLPYLPGARRIEMIMSVSGPARTYKYLVYVTYTDERKSGYTALHAVCSKWGTVVEQAWEHPELVEQMLKMSGAMHHIDIEGE